MLKKRVLALLAFACLQPALGAQENMQPFSIAALQSREYKASPLTIEALIEETAAAAVYKFTYITMNKKISGALTVPKAVGPEGYKGIILMMRGHQYLQGYYIGKGTKYPARYYSGHGYITIAPDFFGFGSSDAPPIGDTDGIESRMLMVVNAIELYKSLQSPRYIFSESLSPAAKPVLPDRFGSIAFWGHSNGGFVALGVLETLKIAVPTVLWAPVSLGFPYNAQYYIGRRGGAAALHMQAYTARFETLFKPKEYSILDNLGSMADNLPLVLRQGDADEDVPKAWSDALNQAVLNENSLRKEAGRPAINFKYAVYSKANHNLEPYWQTVLPDDIAFWESHKTQSH